MKKEKKNNGSFSEILEDIKTNVLILKDYPDENIKISSENILDNVRDAEQNVKGLKQYLFAATFMFVISLILVSISGYYGLRLAQTVDTTDKKHDSIKQVILKGDTAFSYYIDKKGEIIPYEAIANERDSLQQKLNDTKFLLDFATRAYDIKFDITTENSNKSYEISSKAIDVLRKENDDLRDQNQKLERENYNLLIGKIGKSIDSLKRR